jgi:hypothetical protein
MAAIEFNAEEYARASRHQKEWGHRLIAEMTPAVARNSHEETRAGRTRPGRILATRSCGRPYGHSAAVAPEPGFRYGI